MPQSRYGSEGRTSDSRTATDGEALNAREERTLVSRIISSQIRRPSRALTLASRKIAESSGATRRDRTGDLLITNQPLYHLS